MELSGGYGIELISYILADEIWFVIGMCLCVTDFRKITGRLQRGRGIWLGIAGILVFIVLSILVYVVGSKNGIISFLLGLLACMSIVLLVSVVFKENRQNRAWGFLAGYTMPIFLMHTLFAAPLRTVLFKLGIQNAVIHVALGVAISFIGPIIAAKIYGKE